MKSAKTGFFREVNRLQSLKFVVEDNVNTHLSNIKNFAIGFVNTSKYFILSYCSNKYCNERPSKFFIEFVVDIVASV